MGAMDYSLSFKDEVSYATPIVTDRSTEYNDTPAPLKPVAGRTEGNALRVGSRARRASRAVPYFDHAEGTISLNVMDKGFGWWLKHLLPNVAATGSGPFVYTATEGTSSQSMGKSFTAQLNYPFNPTGTNQAVTFSGGKVIDWTLANSADGMLVCEMNTDFAAMSTAIALASLTYPSSMTNLSWAGGVVSVGGSAFDITDFELKTNLNQKTGRKQIRGNTQEKEPTPGPIESTFSLKADFDSLTQWARVHSTTVAGMSAVISGTWTAGTSSLTATVSGARFDDVTLDDDTGLNQTLTGVGEYDGTNSVVTLIYTTSDSTP